MSSVAALAHEPQPRRARKFCTGCGTEKDTKEFYRLRINPRTATVILRWQCKLCEIKAATEDRELRLRRERAEPVEQIAGLGKFVVLPRNAPAMPPPVRLEEIAFVLVEAPPRRPALPPFDTEPRCTRGSHPWPIERVCRGYELLGCDVYGPHVHRRCPTHTCETTEAAPAHFLERRKRVVYLERRY